MRLHFRTPVLFIMASVLFEKANPDQIARFLAIDTRSSYDIDSPWLSWKIVVRLIESTILSIILRIFIQLLAIEEWLGIRDNWMIIWYLFLYKFPSSKTATLPGRMIVFELQVLDHLIRATRQSVVAFSSSFSYDTFSYLPDSVPRSAALICTYTPFSASPPPKTPKPYLNADRKMVLPSKEEVDTAMALRNSYLEVRQAHFAAELTKMATAASKFVAWCSLLPELELVTIYNKQGHLQEESWAVLADFVSRELRSIYEASSLMKQEEMLLKIPEIYLVDVCSHKRVQVVLNLHPTQIERVLTVYVCDLTVKDLPEPPPLSMLTTTMSQETARLSLNGIVCKEEGTTTFLYGFPHNFGFSHFRKALFRYAIDQECNEDPKKTCV